MKRRVICGVIAAILAATSAPARPPVIPPYTPELARRIEIHPFPLTAVYRRKAEFLAFVAWPHLFNASDPRLSLIAKAYDDAKPAIVIVEGFPTAMGDSPAPLVAEANSRLKPNADAYAKSEGMFAASLALAHRIPFVGGEPTQAQETAALLKAGFHKPDILFLHVLIDLAQDIRGGELSSTRDAQLPATFERYSAAEAKSLSIKPLSFSAYLDRYRRMFGVSYQSDHLASQRADPGTESPVGKIMQAEMVIRDSHLHSAILEALETRRRVLVVYGASHWTTLSQALAYDLGQPRFQ